MPPIRFVTGNVDKFAHASTICGQHGIPLEQIVTEIDEIQGEDGEHIVRSKAARAYEIVGKPVVVGDDSWAISALRGFPGAYMKSVNHWFTSDDFLRLMQGIEDRQVILQQRLAYQDEKETVLFTYDLPGTILEHAAGNGREAWLNVVTMDGDDGLSLAEVFAAGLHKQHNAERYRKHPDVWQQLAAWYKAKQA